MATSNKATFTKTPQQILLERTEVMLIAIGVYNVYKNYIPEVALFSINWYLSGKLEYAMHAVLKTQSFLLLETFDAIRVTTNMLKTRLK